MRPALVSLVCFLGAAGCSSHGVSTAPNTLAITANSGPPGVGYINGLFTSVTVCAPGTSRCQRIDYALVDTGSVGLRILSASAGGGLSIALPLETDPAGDALAECAGFIDGYTWGPLRVADVTMGSELARSVPVQVIGDPAFAEVPASCSATGGVGQDSIETVRTFAILGVGPAPQDCGFACAESVTADDTENPGNVYYACSPGACVPAAVPLGAQVQNPVSLLPVDNNGVMVRLPSVAQGGEASVGGSLVFGIGTQANNALGSATVLALDPDTLTLPTTFRGKSYAMSFIDSGSNAIYFLDSSATSLPACPGGLEDFDCPATPGTVAFRATIEGGNGVSSSVSFAVANAEALFTDETNACFADLAGPGAGSDYFDWGLPFFYGRGVFYAIEGASVEGGQTPFVAY